ncbi:unnamed protein product [Vitrella brassicaformis CCMP3155]|uniref:Uncharacterized protein n=1 Tax=Vitrella brassicaformis (strain CCMP3155) TaxID=1169540 RepID=A0A0G4EK83_VITBC|nr:unnamed protein product [Vitrella brassicaformis CCMP3155]|eukprot:CEL97855.1 unnamed protein product [Vitrella brassicaformis CCMP3155]
MRLLVVCFALSALRARSGLSAPSRQDPPAPPPSAAASVQETAAVHPFTDETDRGRGATGQNDRPLLRRTQSDSDKKTKPEQDYDECNDDFCR